jgi:hypothetical protein
MSDRDFFSLRYAIPGYTLILVIILLNAVPLFEIAKDNSISLIFGAILAFVSLFTGSAIGFLVSQIWMWYFNSIGGIFSVKGSGRVKDMLVRKMEPIKVKEVKRKDLSVILDYSMSQDKDKDIMKSLINRVDLFHLLSATVFCLGIGLALGIGLRTYFEVVIFNGSVFRDWTRFAGLELLAQIFVASAAIFMAVLIWKKGRNYPMINYWNMILLIDPAVDREKIEQCFPEYF